MTGTIPALLITYSTLWLTHIYIWVSKRASRCVWRLCCCLVKIISWIFLFFLFAALSFICTEKRGDSGRPLVGKRGLKIVLDMSDYDLENLKICNSLVFYYLLNFNLMIWNIIAMLNFSYPIQGASIPWGNNQADRIFQATNTEELVGSMFSVLDVKILSLLILQLVYFPTI